MSTLDIIFMCMGAFSMGTIIGHRFLPPRINIERERMLSDLLAREVARKLRGDL